MNPRVCAVKYQHPYKLILTFSNGEVSGFDMKNYLDYPVYKKLKDPELCSNAKVFRGTVVWEDDIDPDTLYIESIPILEPAP